IYEFSYIVSLGFILCTYVSFFFFFFSSRRRHTRFKCDWSSDVCSSDLAGPFARQSGAKGPASANHVSNVKPEIVRRYANMLWLRSEERRVGKEGRSRWSPEQ